MSLKKSSSERLAKRTVQLIGFGLATALIIVRIVTSINDVESGISEYFIAGLIGVGVSAEVDFSKLWRRNDDK